VGTAIQQLLTHLKQSSLLPGVVTVGEANVDPLDLLVHQADHHVPNRGKPGVARMDRGADRLYIAGVTVATAVSAGPAWGRE
jgi:hypothetical protein